MDDAICAEDGCRSDPISERVVGEFPDGVKVVELVCAVHADEKGVGAPSEVVEACRAATLLHSEN